MHPLLARRRATPRRRVSGPKRRRTSSDVINSRERALAGVIVTFVRTTDGAERVRHLAGHAHESKACGARRSITYGVRDVLRDMVRLAESWGPEWKIQTISTPATVLSDVSSRAGTWKQQAMPEANMLRQIGRPDMWAGKVAQPDKARTRAARRKERAGV